MLLEEPGACHLCGRYCNDLDIKLERSIAMLRFTTTILLLAAVTIGPMRHSSAQTGEAHSYVANTMPPDAFLALKSYPSSNSPRIMAMANGTKVEVLLRRGDGWWLVKVWPTGEQGWAFSGQGNKAYILCCTEDNGSQTEAKPAAKEITDFTCDQLWLGRNSIFKEAGYCFKTPRAIAAFGNAGCLYDDIAAVRLSVENENLSAAIQRAEQANACPR